jgi:hypothetical protein
MANETGPHWNKGIDRARHTSVNYALFLVFPDSHVYRFSRPGEINRQCSETCPDESGSTATLACIFSPPEHSHHKLNSSMTYL